VHFADLVVDAGVVQDPLGGGGLARVDVGHDPDVPDLREVLLQINRHFGLNLPLLLRPVFRAPCFRGQGTALVCRALCCS